MGCTNQVLGPLPKGYGAAPILREQSDCPLRAAAVVRSEADPSAGHFVILRDTFDARVYLGALIDQAAAIHDYIEIHVQTLESVRAQTFGPGGLTNAILDQRWQEQSAAWSAADPSSIIITGYEKRHGCPILIDIAKLQPVDLPGSEAEGWQLCQDDALLESAGLPAFSKSIDRYLHQPKLGKDGPFVALHADSPSSKSTILLQDLLGQTDAAPFNAGAGLMRFRYYQPLSLEEFFDTARGKEWSGLQHGRATLQWPGADSDHEGAAEQPLGGQPFFARQGKSAQAIEGYFLTIGAIASALAAVRDIVRQTQRPILSLTPANLRVGLGPTGPGMPLLWSAKVSLADQGDSVGARIEGTDTTYFARAGTSAASIYQPADVHGAVSGRGSFRIRQVIAEKRGTLVEGTFTPREKLDASANDLLRIRVGIAAGRIDLYTRLDPQMAMASGEWRLRSLPQSLAPATAVQLQAAEGVPMGNVDFELIPFQSSPCDLYSLGVIAARGLLLKPGASLAVALDEVMSLGRQAGLDAASAHGSLPERIGAIFAKDSRWATALGPAAFFSDGATDMRRWLIPPTLWWETLGAVVRMLPGLGPDSLCADYGAAPPGAIHRVFDQSLIDWNALIAKARGLLLGDWQLDREMHDVIGWFAESNASGKTAPAVR